jgi:hypothetical protein
LPGLYDHPGKGQKPIINQEQREQIQQWVKLYPKNLNKVISLIQKEFEIKASKSTVKRILKFCQMTWRRIRRKVRGQPDPAIYQERKEAKDLAAGTWYAFPEPVERLDLPLIGANLLNATDSRSICSRLVCQGSKASRLTRRGLPDCSLLQWIASYHPDRKDRRVQLHHRRVSEFPLSSPPLSPLCLLVLVDA